MLPLDETEIEIVRYLKGRMAIGESAVMRDLVSILAPAYGTTEITPEVIARDLAAIVEVYALASMPDVIAMLSPDQHWKYGLPAEGDSDVERYWGNWVRAFSSILTLCDITKLPGYTPT